LLYHIHRLLNPVSSRWAGLPVRRSGRPLSPFRVRTACRPNRPPVWDGRSPYPVDVKTETGPSIDDSSPKTDYAGPFPSDGPGIVPHWTGIELDSTLLTPKALDQVVKKN